MSAITLFAMVCALLTVVTRFSGISSMAQGGEDDQHRSHLLMFRRVGWQALAVLAVFIGMLSQMH